jgi:hypothetical protein
VSSNQHAYPCDTSRRSPVFNIRIIMMNKKEITETLWAEVLELEALIKKLQARSGRLRTLALDLHAEVTGANIQDQQPVTDSKFRKAIDLVFGEKPKQPKR